MATETRGKILAAAEQIMRTRGLAQATTREIARAAQLSEGALYKHFQDKDDLFLAVFRERLPSLADVFTALPARAGKATVEVNLTAFAEEFLAFGNEVVPLTAALFSQPELLARYRMAMRDAGGDPGAALAAVAAYIAAEQDLGRINDRIRPQGAAALLVGTCHEYAFVRHLHGGPEVAPSHFAREIVQTLLTGLSPPAAPAA